MLQDIRQNIQGTAAKIVVWLIVIAFAGFGIESILLGGGSSGVAEVNGEEISPQEVQQMVNTQKRQLIAMLGENIDPALLDDQRLSGQALEGIIQRRLLAQSAGDMKLTVSESELGRIIAGMEQFQMNGEFSPEVYKSALAQAGFTPSSFKAGLQQDLVINQLRSGLVGSEFATPAELDLTASIVAEQRDVRYLTIPYDSAQTDVQVGEEQIEAYYRENESDFYSRETVVLNYIELALEDFFEPVDENELQSLYEQEKNSYQYRTENRVSHILLTRGEGESDADFSARVSAVQSALDGGEAFAAVAGEYSDDVGSASAGGDLGFSGGDAFPEAMEEAIASLEVGAVSPPVETDAGTHFIQVTERRDGDAPSLAELRPELEQRIREREARARLLSAVEELRDIAFNAQDLEGPAAELDLEVQRSEPVARNQLDGLFASPSLLSAAFSEDVLELGHNSEVVELSPRQFVVLRVAEHNPPALQPLDSVREDIVATITERQVREAISARAEQAVARLRQGESVEDVADDLGYEWQLEIGAEQDAGMLPPAVAAAAFRLPAPAEGETRVDFTLTAAGDAQVIEVSRVSPGSYASLSAPRQQQLRQQIGRELGELVLREYQQGLRKAADITVY
ncbi:SurA N-terminal domain-containing protein [Parahaliea mediterranea]|uniref:Periplasmic chaperone PpiD n=1 Tax=Parahaliea mediterranea TaxID=651086 RepID=A0A939DHS5_9GAMM|nr:SurA N-terminal domain-containing protein [Parahaliea mediterranea]MBN7797712.1 SurA N-terminal domain-containing protein [Parahaliea mediterranea]